MGPVSGEGGKDAGRRLSSPSLFRAALAVTAIAGIGASIAALSRTEGDAISLIVESWPSLLGAAGLYIVGMALYATSWAALFDPEDDRTLLALTFLGSQPVKYLPGGFAQPLSQVALSTTATRSRRSGVVAFPVHVLINVVAALTLASPGLFLGGLPDWARWGALALPLLWASLDRRWILWLLRHLGRAAKVFRVSGDVPGQRRIARSFAIALPAHALMFSSFGVIADSATPGSSVLILTVIYGLGWVAGYLVMPAPAGLGAREAALVALLAWSVPALGVIKISIVHRVTTLSIELVLMGVALVMAGTRSRRADPPTAHEGSSS